MGKNHEGYWDSLTTKYMKQFPEYTAHLTRKNIQISKDIRDLKRHAAEQKANTINPKPELKISGAPPIVSPQSIDLEKELNKKIHEGTKDIRDFIKTEQQRDSSHIIDPAENERALEELEAEIEQQKNEILEIDPQMPAMDKAIQNTKDITGQQEVVQQQPEIQQNAQDITEPGKEFDEEAKRVVAEKQEQLSTEQEINTPSQEIQEQKREEQRQETEKERIKREFKESYLEMQARSREHQHER